MLPETKNSPTHTLETIVIPSVSKYIVIDLFAPEFGIILRPPKMFRTSMPKTSVHKDGDLDRGKI